MKKDISFLIILFFTSFSFSQVVNTEFGQIEGEKLQNCYRFLGIPYAKAPIGELRWKAPENPDTWSDIMVTKTFAPACPQKEYNQGDTIFTLRGDEDCLYLNIWTPDTDANDLPVFFFIHGGGNQQGSAYSLNSGTNLYDGENMSIRGNSVIVTIQYRLGPLGFLVHPGLEEENINSKSGNYAVLDQILALKWVKNNIANFGGDPQKIMIFGESAGAVDVGNLLCTDKSEGLFQRACMESGIPVIGLYSDAKLRGIDYVNGYTNSGSNTEKITFMRKVDAIELVKNNSTPFEGGIVEPGWGAVKDDIIFNDYSFLKFQNGDFNTVPVIIGSNSEEASLTSPLLVTPTMVETLINSFIPLNYREEARQLYSPGINNEQARESYINFLSDMQFVSTARKTAECIAANQEEPVWRYFFTYKHSIPQLEKYGSYHGMELFYVFNNWENTLLGSGFLFKDSDKSVQDNMLKYWVNFAKSGNPNSEGLELWPEFKEGFDCYLDIKADPDGSNCGIRKPETDFWYKVKNVNYCPFTIDSDNEPNIITYIDFFYPNPAWNFIHLQNELIKNNFKIEIIDINGKTKIISRNTDIDISTLNSGVYMIKLKIEDKILLGKLVKI